MTFTNLTKLIGLKSTDEKIVNWFETNNLGKVPKTINSNQDTKGATDKINLLSYTFKFDITNDAFYPPLNPKKDNYNFECFLSYITVFSKTKNKDFKDPKPLSFWEGFINPESTFEECCVFFDNKYHESNFDGEIINVTFEKKLSDVANVIVFFKGDRSHIKAIELRIQEEYEIVDQYVFLTDNEHNTTKQAYTLLVKWMFNNKYLKLSDEIYNLGLSTDDATILQFTKQHLRNHIWDNQITETTNLRSFLYKISSNTDIELKNGEKVNVYIRHLYIKASGQWEAHQKIYNKKDDLDRFEKVDQLENSIYLDEKHIDVFLNKLTEMFTLFSENKKID